MLEIRVFDDVITRDSLDEALEVIIAAAKEWFDSDDKRPFKLTLKKLGNKAPPALEINASDQVVTRAAFG